VAGVVSYGAGDVGVAGEPQEADEQVAVDGQGVGPGAGPGLVKVFAEGDVADPVEAVFDSPVVQMA
jgi:antitoxin Phd